MEKKVCHVTSLHPYHDGRIFEHYCKTLSKKYEVYLIAPNTETRVEDGVHIVGVPLPTINQRRERWMKLNSILPYLYEVNADIYHFHDPELMGIGLKLKKKGKKIIFDSHEDILNQMSQKGFVPKPFRKIVSKIYGIHERRCLKQYDAVVSVTGFIVDRLKNINPNTYQITNYPKFEGRTIPERKWSRTICFAGLLSEDWMLTRIINVLPKINVRLLMAGIYSTEDYLNKLKSLPGWKNVEFYGTLPHNQVLELYNNCSIGMAIESYSNPNVGFRKGSLGITKIPDYMASGLPIIVSDSEVWGGVVREFNCGIVVVDPTDEAEIANAINSIFDNIEGAKMMSENALKATREVFNWGTQENIVFEMYNKVLKS